MKIQLWIAMLSLSTGSFSQAIDNTNAFRNTGSDHYFRFYYENDFFTASDEYYTQGIQFEWAHPRIKKFFLSKILVHLKEAPSIHGIAVETEGYTPVYIDRSEVQYGDRPFASSILFKTFSISIKRETKIRIASTFTAGVIGPAAGGKEIQTSIHRWIGYTLPTGWVNQVRNDVVLNYQVNMEKNLVQGNVFRLLGDVSARAGSYSTKFRGGFSVIVGKSPSLFENPLHGKKLFYYVYMQPQVNFIGYDATLQGGLFNRSSPYTIAAKNISRITFQDRLGVVVMKGNIYLEYFQYYLTKEFSSGHMHRSGGIQVGYFFKDREMK
ncbi:MAG TPA: lipid A deacylase LpxR family protein [Flavitalea sp.]|nr:lipid A deacylase LpxR family protein [Flavitalea sp.]